MSVQPVGLDLGIGNEPCLVRMGQHHFLNLLKLFELLMHQAPVPARFHHRLAWTIQTGEKLRKTIRGIAFHSPLPQFAPRLIQRAKHAVLLVHIHSNVVHENSFLSFSSLRTGELLSFYLTPIDPRSAVNLPLPLSPRNRPEPRWVRIVFRRFADG